jgi:hypothetical protein
MTELQELLEGQLIVSQNHLRQTNLQIRLTVQVGLSAKRLNGQRKPSMIDKTGNCKPYRVVTL